MVHKDILRIGIFKPEAGAAIFGGGAKGVHGGAFASGGAFAGGPGYGGSAPQCQGKQTAAVGAFAGVGVGGFLTNATEASQLGGYANTYSLNVGMGFLKFGAQLSLSGDIWLLGVTFGPGGFFSGSMYPTHTWTTK